MYSSVNTGYPRFSFFLKKYPGHFTVLILILFFLICDLLLGFIIIPGDHNRFRTRHPYYHHGLLPGKTDVASWNSQLYPMVTNSLGFRDSACRKIEGDSNRKRILFLGDSHTEGVGVNYAQTFTGILQSGLAGMHIDVLNGSAVSYSPKIYYLKLWWLIEKEGFRPDELVVCLDFSDLQNELVYEHYNPKEPGVFTRFWFKITGFLRYHSFVFHQIHRIRINIETNRFLDQVKDFDSRRDRRNPRSDALELYAGFFSGFHDVVLLSDPGFHGVERWIYNEYIGLAENGISLAMGNLEKLIDLCSEKKISLTLSVHPWKEQMHRADTTDWYIETWRQFAHDHKTGFINLYPAFINNEVGMNFEQDPFLPSDNHWNVYGHQLIANKFLRYFQDRIKNEESDSLKVLR